MRPYDITSIGLVCDIVGAILIWQFGLPEEIYRSGRVPAIYNPAAPEAERKIKKYDAIARIGVVTLILGFVLQLVGSELPRFFPDVAGARKECRHDKPIPPIERKAEESASLPNP